MGSCILEYNIHVIWYDYLSVISMVLLQCVAGSVFFPEPIHHVAVTDLERV